MKKIIFNEEEEKEIIKLYEYDLLSIKDIGKKFNISENPINRILIKNNINTESSYRQKLLFKNGKRKLSGCAKLSQEESFEPKNKIKFTEEQKNKIVNLYKDKFCSIKEIGNRINLSHSPVVRILKEKGIDTSSSNRKKLLFKEGILKPIHGFEGHKHTESAKKKQGESSKLRKGVETVKLDEDKIKELYVKGNSSYEIADILNTNFATILNRLKKLGVNRRKPLYNKRINCVDGHYCRSSPELFIDNWLFYNKIFHVPERRIGTTQFKTDFYIPEIDVYIEYWGLESIKSYRDKMIKKLNVYKELNLRLISIFPKDNIIFKLEPLIKYLEIEDFEKNGVFFYLENPINPNGK